MKNYLKKAEYILGVQYKDRNDKAMIDPFITWEDAIKAMKEHFSKNSDKVCHYTIEENYIPDNEWDKMH